ncbi:MAG TPA: (Fe-S)-binding protein [Candidatus Atribacteria bacterium]|nr:(Fe-S)-binding protein [Candidatus Atribacteria bacterium]
MTKEYVWPIERGELEDYYDMMLACAKCKYCQNVFPCFTQNEQFASQCPSGDYWRFEAYYASGRIEIARGIVEGSLNWSDKLRDILYSCTMCGACEENCRTTQRLTPLKIIRTMRERYIREGGELLSPHKGMVDSLLKEHNPYGKTHKSRFKWLSSDLISSVQDSDVIYFVDCTMCYQVPHLARVTTQVLAKLGVNFTVLGNEEWCCGVPLFRLGLVEEGKKLLDHCIKAIEKTGISKVIFSDPSCYETFKNASLYGFETPSFEMQHITEFLLPILKKNKVDLHEVKGKITYHDSPFLSRHLRIYEEPREILKMIPGVELIEMYRNRLNTFDCAGEITVKEAFPEFAVETAKKRIGEAKAMGANTIVCADPNDYRNFVDAKTDLNVMDIMEILLKSLNRGD